MTTTALPAARTTLKATLTAVGIAAAGSLVVNTAIALGARALGAPEEFQPLTLPVYGTLSVVGVLISAVAWRLVVARSRAAGRMLRVLVPVVLVLSLIPDVVLLATQGQPGTTATGVIALMLMHAGVAAVAVPAYRRFMPPRT
ncbi:DUF6069 family protein [Dactylosporangium matsuzakiense]|uniref:Uncharacterized protein n=1 Tax=Dactylosporangium matsuzakiense TaxID=53360 RepID=A0A9W6KG09_9ACTN|nr:DUF6069 family protein [Dactylosporangium matsuzakiense]UWZ48939.1 hypothetical protein Dmats_22615 [Dactylosporangium matsuzakiense]GLL00833.1 hypothetical protein GCM10017581_025740 [Dactylosporangium matsuzakiense]